MLRAIRALREGRVFLFLLVVMSASAAHGQQTTAFTYQGQLSDAGALANNSYDLRFALFDSTAGGIQIGAPQAVPAVSVKDGVFTVQLDFGVTAFPGANRFLEIGVRPAGGGSFTTLAPRQQISSSPYAIRTLSAATADTLSSACVGCVKDTQIQGVAGSKVSGTIPAASVPSGSGNYIQNTTAQQPSSNFNIAGNGVVGGDLTVAGTLNANLSGNFIQNRTTPQAGGNFNISGNGTAGGTLSGNIVNATTQYNIGGNRVLGTPGTDNLVAGVDAGSANTTGQANSFFGVLAGQLNTKGGFNSFFGSAAGGDNTEGGGNSFFGSIAGRLNTIGDDNSFFGVNAGQSNTIGNNNSFFGNEAGFSNKSGSDNTMIGHAAGVDVGSDNLTNATAIGALARVAQSNSLVLGSIAGVGFATASVKVGIGTTTPQNTLHVKGSTLIEAGGSGGNVLFATPNGETGMAIVGTNRADVRFDGLTLKLVAGKGPGAQPSTNGVAITTLGNVGIGTTAPARAFDVAGRARVGVIPLEASAAAVCFNSAGDLLQCGASSLRFKTNVRPFLGGLDIVRRLRPINFNWKESGSPDIGLGAEDVAKVAPSLTFVNSKGEAEGVKYERLNLLLINAVKEQQDQIVRQQLQIEQLLRMQNADAHHTR
jgi:hypothetical protein